MKQWWGLGFIVLALWAVFQKEDRIFGGLADNRDDDEFDPDAITEGAKVEMEHTRDINIAREIAKDHLVEDPLYYKKLARIEGKRNPRKIYRLPKATSAAQMIRAIHRDADDNQDLLVDDITYQELGLPYGKR